MPCRCRKAFTTKPASGTLRTGTLIKTTSDLRLVICDYKSRITNQESQTMLLRDKINADIAIAMKSKEPARLSALRMLKAAIMNKGIEKSHDLDDAEVLQVVSTLVKQRRDSIDQFSKAGRTDLVDKETAEIAVLEQYLPPAATAADIDAAVAEAIAETGAVSVKDMGKVMKAVMPRLAGKNADGRAVSEAVRRKLGP